MVTITRRPSSVALALALTMTKKVSFEAHRLFEVDPDDGIQQFHKPCTLQERSSRGTCGKSRCDGYWEIR